MKTQKIQIHEILSKFFNKKDILCVPQKILKYKINFFKIKNIEKFINKCVEDSKNAKFAGFHRKNDWEKGWGGQGIINSSKFKMYIPYYFKKNKYLRINNEVWEDLDGYGELILLRSIQHITFNKALKIFRKKLLIIEFGCGVGHNILYLKKYFKEYKWGGSDWASTSIEFLKKNKVCDTKYIRKVDFFDTKTFWKVQEKYICFTNAALEQTGLKYKKFINHLINDNYCTGGIHIEPMQELLNNSPLEKNSKYYANKRGYLKNFIKFIQNKKNVIVFSKKILIGSKFMFGYQIMYWKKIDENK